MNQKQKHSNRNLSDLLGQNQINKKCTSLPLEFAFLPVEILSKEFTKLNHNHPYRIHYLGTRPHNTLAIHKKYARTQKAPFQMTSMQSKIPVQKYTVDTKKIIQSFTMLQKLKGNSYYKQTLFYRAFEGMNPTLNLQKQYVFNSIFQAGNLDCVIKIKQTQFDLFLRIDSNTKGHVQWFYFSVKNNKRKQKIKLNLCNLSKPNTLYENGMKPFVFSKQRFKSMGVDWLPGGVNLSLQKKQLRYEYLQDKINKLSYYCLQFQYEFQYQNDEVFFAYCIPFTYSKLIHQIKLLQDKYVKKSTLGKTLSGVNIPILHITNFQDTIIKKKNVLITGRMHPGQSNSSHMLQGFIQFLTSNSKVAQKLRMKVNFYIIPMVNPDGVIIGNTRTSTAGKDLNRQFLIANKDIYPQVFLVKDFAKKLHYQNEIFLYLDFHGHSKKKNTFCYGPSYNMGQPNYYKCRIFPKLIEKIDSNFRYHSCSFAIDDIKKQTARGVLFQQMKINFTYTIQTSIGYFYNCQEFKTYQFTVFQWKKMGHSIGQALQKFIQGYEQFEQYIKQRRANRQKRKKVPKSLNIQFQAQYDQMITPYKKFEPLKISYKEKVLFSELIDEMKVINKQSKNANFIKQLDQDIESDNNDENEDFQLTKLKQFNNLLTLANQKSTKISPCKVQISKQDNLSQMDQLNDEAEQQRNFFLEMENNFKSNIMGANQKKQVKLMKQKSQQTRSDMMKTHYVNRSNMHTQNNVCKQKIKTYYKMPLQYHKDMKRKVQFNSKNHQFKDKQKSKSNSYVTQFLLFGFEDSSTSRTRGNRRLSSYFDKDFIKINLLSEKSNKKPMSENLLQKSHKFNPKVQVDYYGGRATARISRQFHPQKPSTNYQFKFDEIQKVVDSKSKMKPYIKNKAAKSSGLGPASFYGIRQNQNLKILNKRRIDYVQQSFKVKKQQMSVINFI